MSYKHFLFFFFLTLSVFCQNDILKKFNISGYGEFYYSYDFSNPSNHTKPNFLYNHKRHNEVNVNLMIIKTDFSDENYRANFSIMAGNYPQYNLSSEPTWAQFINEANLGIKLSNKNNLWLDVGILPSHIGFESAISSDCWTLTRSILAENSPYYETGIKLGYRSRGDKLYLAFLYLNGWQHIKKPNYILNPSFGTQINYQASKKLSINYSTFLGSDKPDSIHSFRHFHNIYLLYEPSNETGIIAGFDIGSDKYNTKQYGTWYSPVIIIRQYFNNKTQLAIRGEYYNDPNQIMITTGSPKGFQTLGLSANLDYEIMKNIKVRIEPKLYLSKDEIFDNKKQNFSITSNLTIKL
ncbi:porin [Flavobacterium oreochromis]|uniref:Porin n=1 Tax=Flavobacterium oreochromis TaxID=2906078 RepID=A0ABW8PAM2_9FLAO|nr:porin [Flavobacterium oreochromis]OWP76719.1 hypothetical protein BWG23_07330 [Flavobacterium oreochromis]POR23003.1 hypothetical protein BWK58_10370 [Flavobacterium columnare]